MKAPFVAGLHSGSIAYLGDGRRRKRKSRNSGGLTWDRSTGKLRLPGRVELRRMFWMLIGGTLLFVLLVAGVLIAMLGGDKTSPPVAESAMAKPAPRAMNPDGSPAVMTGVSDAAFLAAAEPLTRKFLEATRIEEILPLVRNPAVAEARMRRQYPTGKIAAPGMLEFNANSEISRNGTIRSLKIRTRAYDEKALAFGESQDGPKIDWESWVGWSEMPWEKFLASRPGEAMIFRVYLSPVDYFNFAFSDEAKWQSYRLESPDGAHSIYGYVERGSALSAKLLTPSDARATAVMLALKFPESATSHNQVIIEKFIADGWVLETEEPP